MTIVRGLASVIFLGVITLGLFWIPPFGTLPQQGEGDGGLTEPPVVVSVAADQKIDDQDVPQDKSGNSGQEPLNQLQEDESEKGVNITDRDPLPGKPEQSQNPDQNQVEPEQQAVPEVKEAALNAQDLANEGVKWRLMETDEDLLYNAMIALGAHPVWIDKSSLIYDEQGRILPSGLFAEHFLERGKAKVPAKLVRNQVVGFFAFREKRLNMAQETIFKVHQNCFRDSVKPDESYVVKLFKAKEGREPKFHLIPVLLKKGESTLPISAECYPSEIRNLTKGEGHHV